MKKFLAVFIAIFAILGAYRNASALSVNHATYETGDTIYVKETFLERESGFIFKADFEAVEAAGISGMYGGWKPSISMPRALSRIDLLCTAVRVERLHDISEADAKAEGCSYPAHGPQSCYRSAYKSLWETINGPGSWDANPWVWALTAKRIEGGKA